MLKPSTTWVHQCTPQYPKYRNLQFAIVWVKVGQSFQESSNNSLWSSPNPSRSLYMFFQLYPCFNPNKYLQFQFKQVPVPAKKPSKPKNNPETHICPALQQILHHLLLTWWRGVWGEHGRVNNRKMTGFMVGKMTYDNVSWGTSWFTIDFAVFFIARIFRESLLQMQLVYVPRVWSGSKVIVQLDLLILGQTGDSTDSFTGAVTSVLCGFVQPYGTSKSSTLSCFSSLLDFQQFGYSVPNVHQDRWCDICNCCILIHWCHPLSVSSWERRPEMLMGFAASGIPILWNTFLDPKVILYGKKNMLTIQTWILGSVNMSRCMSKS